MGLLLLPQSRWTLYVLIHSKYVLLTQGSQGGDNRGVSGQSFILARLASVSVNGGTPVTLRQRSGSSGIILSQPLNVTFTRGGGNSITFSGFNGSECQLHVKQASRVIIFPLNYSCCSGPGPHHCIR